MGCGLPGLLPFPGHGTFVKGEVWEVPSYAIFSLLDPFEGAYSRRALVVEPVQANDHYVTTEAYFYPDRLPGLNLSWWTNSNQPEPNL